MRRMFLALFFCLFLISSVLAATLNINSATKEQLQTLPGIGPAIAERIVLYREQFGPFKSPDDLLKVKGIGAKKLEKIKPFLSFE